MFTAGGGGPTLHYGSKVENRDRSFQTPVVFARKGGIPLFHNRSSCGGRAQPNIDRQRCGAVGGYVRGGRAWGGDNFGRGQASWC